MKLAGLKKRAEFLAVRGGYRFASPACVIEAKRRRGQSPGSRTIALDSARFGYTVTKKLGNAVVRNKIRRRLKAAVADVAPALAVEQFDYVVVARRAAFDMPFAELTAHVSSSLRRIRERADKASAATRRADDG